MPVAPTDAVVLAVEDNPDNLFIVEILLGEDLRVKAFHGLASGRALFKLLESHPTMQPDLVLLDIQLPSEDGYAVFDAMRGVPQLAGARVVAVTANVMPNDIARAQSLGFNGLIGKPIDRRRFPGQIARILNGEEVWEPY